jgi:hypothetical protein
VDAPFRCDYYESVSRPQAKVVLGAVLVASALVAALGARAATQNAPPYLSPTPSNSLTVLVVIDDKGITATAFRQLGTGNSSSLETLKGPLPHGNLVTFNVYNRGKSLHNFMVFGKKTPAIAPGKNAHLYFKLGSAGRFAYQSTLDKSAAFHGYLTVK